LFNFEVLSKKKKKVQKLDLFPSSGEGKETPALMGPLEKANINHSPHLNAVTDQFLKCFVF
jgi:hypothetical protein